MAEAAAPALPLAPDRGKLRIDDDDDDDDVDSANKSMEDGAAGCVE